MCVDHVIPSDIFLIIKMTKNFEGLKFLLLMKRAGKKFLGLSKNNIQKIFNLYKFGCLPNTYVYSVR